VYAAFRDGSGVDDAISGVLAVFGYSLLMVFVLWAVSWTVERGVGTLSRRVAVWLGIVLVALAVVAAAVGLIYADQRVDGLGGYMEERWDELVADRYDTPTDSGSRFGAFGLNGRLTQWKIAARAFADIRYWGWERRTSNSITTSIGKCSWM
jgi:hypothetical protein